ncbi:unnamed protein product [Linum trigynum]|uniref:Reverse transcriptase n=1 Tax=Linum trigynum TaxID=586398 RepID=A0AAV2GSQ4_9ROSI
MTPLRATSHLPEVYGRGTLCHRFSLCYARKGSQHSSLKISPRKDLIEGVKVAPCAPRISHLFFADDSYLFLRSSLQECENLIEVLNVYEELSGPKINLAKSAVCFSKNIAPPDQEFLAQILGVGAVGVYDKYLGLTSLIAQSKMVTFQYLEEKLLDRLKGWKQLTLSWAAKETLIKYVALALPLHVMSYFKLPLSLCRILDKHVARFWWGMGMVIQGFGGSPGVRCERVNMMGVVGFRHFEHVNQALFSRTPVTLSWGWLSIRELLKAGLIWQIGNGRMASFLHSNWLPRSPPSTPVYNPRVIPDGKELPIAEVIF